MKNKFSYLKDELAIDEIRKHKWIESEKRGHEVGFASAALDWIKRYGYAWRQFRSKLMSPQDILMEKRRHRRFSYQLPCNLKIKNKVISSVTNNISVIGLSCTVPDYVPNDTQTKVSIRFKKMTALFPKLRFDFDSRILRVSQLPDERDTYNIFLPFSEEVRDYIRSHADYFNN